MISFDIGPKSAEMRRKSAAMGGNYRDMMIGAAKKYSLRSVAIALSSIFVLEAASAQSLKELRARDAEEKALDREAAYTESQCGTSINASIDWRSAANWPDNVSLASSCDGALGALEAHCRSNGKARVTRFVCAGDGSGASLRGSTLRYGASPGANGFAETKAVLDGAN